MIKIGLLTTSFPKFSGDSHAPWILEIAKKINQNPFKVTIMAPSDKSLKDSSNIDGIYTQRFRYAPKKFECVAYGANIPSNLKNSWIARLVFPLFIIGFILGAVKLYKNNQILHAQFGYSGLFLVLSSFFSLKKKPIIVSFYGRDVAHAKKYKFLYRLMFKKIDKILVLGIDMKKRLVNIGAPEEKIIVHHLGVDCKKMKKKRSQKKHKEFIFLCIANFVEKKGLEKLIDAFAKLNGKYDNLQLRIVGRGPLENKLKNHVEFLNLTKFVKFQNNYLSKDPRKLIYDEYSMADVFVLPGLNTKNDYGGTPIVLMEAGAMNLPSVTCENAGNAEIIKNTKTGFVVRDCNSKNISEQMENLFVSKKLRNELGNNARVFVKKHFNLENQTKALIDIYNNIN